MTISVDHALLECFEDAAMQAWLMAPRVHDVRMQQSTGDQGLGWKFSYAVDTNIFHAFVNPTRDYRSAKIPPGRIFRFDSADRQYQIAASLLNFIWTELAGKAVPLLVLPPIDREVAGAVDQVINAYQGARGQVPNEGAEVENHTLNAVLAQVAKEGHELTPQDVAEIRELLLLNPGEFPALRRMRMLFEQQKIVNSGRLGYGAGVSQAVREGLRGAGDRDEVVAFSKMRSSWVKRLMETGRPKSVQAERDAEALARLEMCNKRLADAKIRERLVYITLDSSIIESGESYIWPHVEATRQGSLPDEPAGVFGRPPISFTGLFVRHPRAYLNEETVLRPPVTNKFPDRESRPSSDADLRSQGLGGWLTVLLGRLVDFGPIPAPRDGKMNLPENMVKAVNGYASAQLKNTEPDEDIGAIQKNMLDEWNKFEAAAIRDIPEIWSDQIKKALKTIECEEGEIRFFDRLQKIRKDFAKELNEHFENVIRATIQARFVFQVSEFEPLPAREVVPLYFEARPALIAFMSAAHRWLRNEKGGRPRPFLLTEYQDLRVAVQLEGDPDEKRIEPTGYGDDLAHAHLFALMGQWTTAAVLARRAGEMAMREVKNPLGPNGREAYYFEAFCKRYSARSPRDLIGLKELLEKALNISSQEMACPNVSRLDHDPIEERFKGELLALKVSATFFAWHRATEGEKNTTLRALDEPVSEMHQLRDECEIRRKKLEVEFGDDPSSDKMLPIVKHRLDCLWRVATRQTRNILAIALLDLNQPRDRGENAWQWLEINRENPYASHKNDALDESFLAQLLSACAKARFAEKREDRIKAASNLSKRWDRFQTDAGRAEFERMCVLPYDRARFELVIDQAIAEGSRG